ncbi:uncharacterized protein MELLADRAFT_94932 [Melampsora larici-populina 98AG31]|uniref:glutathione peroxidase n=1 Tax=Melampsora larici-populina (strain 98AG31 / pathotype 3-4-7) TaxID=747676 RepID=F4S8J7_MELLP|nr:uncharacterized protein MELLADRAFT_94932 [Melampsora larici-populina 98AG31]EGF99002.1 hypothetical protein MELLADRAFT_94932 [Melampsora larici-populina 98AG31]
MTSEEIKKKVEDAINDHAIVAFTKSHCPYCKATKKTFEELNKEIHVVELDQCEDGAEIQAYLKTKTGQGTVPNIFIHQNHIGGNSDLQKLKEEGELLKMFH